MFIIRFIVNRIVDDKLIKIKLNKDTTIKTVINN